MFHPPWEPDFDFYATEYDASISRSDAYHDKTSKVVAFVDLAAKKHAPLASHPMRLQVRVAMLHPREDGLRADDEAEALFGVEDSIAERVIEALDAVYVGRVISEGFVSFAFYFPAEKTSMTRDFGRIMGGVTPYAPQWRMEEDTGWSYFLEFLYPDEEHLTELLSRRAREKFLSG